MPQIIFLSPVPWCYCTYSTRYHSVPIVAAAIPVGTAVISKHVVPVTVVLPRFYRGHIPDAALYFTFVFAECNYFLSFCVLF